jgi:hypothetical protein
MIPELFLDGARAQASVKSIAQTLESMPDRSTVEQFDGTQAGLGTNYGATLNQVGDALGVRLANLKLLLADHADALQASIDALSKTDELAADEAKALTQLISDAKGPAVPPAPASGGMKYDY